MAREHKLLEKMAEELDLSEEPLPGQPIVELAGDRRVLIEKHRGVTQYCSEKICVKVKYGHIAICGCKLELNKMTRDQLVITGRIDSVNIYRRNGQ